MQTQENLIQEVKTSYLDKLVICYQDNEMLRQQEHMSLFTQEALSMFSHIIDACRGNNEQLHELLDDEDGEFFTDEQAKEFVNWRVFGTPMRSGNNIYEQKLAEINKPKVSQSIGAQRAQAKKDRETAVFKEIEKSQNQAVGNFVTLDVDDITPEDETKIRSVLDKITPKGYAFKGCTVYLPINSKAKMSSRNTGIIYGESEAANRCREKVGKVVRTINGLGYQCTIPGITQIKKKDGTPQNLAYFNVNKKVNIHETYMNTKQTNMNNDKLTRIISESIKKALFESEDETQRLFDFLVDNNIATENELILVTNINGYKPETLLAILKARTGYNSPEQYMSAECPDGECELDESFKNAVNNFKNKVKGVGKKISDYADKEWEDEPVKKKSGESIWGRNTPRK